MMPKEESKKQLITRATQYGVDPNFDPPSCVLTILVCINDLERREFQETFCRPAL